MTVQEQAVGDHVQKRVIPLNLSRGWLVVALGWFMLALSADLFIQRNGLDLFSPGSDRELHNNDFRHSYTAASLLRDGGNIYDDQQLREEAARRGVDRLNPYEIGRAHV